MRHRLACCASPLALLPVGGKTGYSPFALHPSSPKALSPRVGVHFCTKTYFREQTYRDVSSAIMLPEDVLKKVGFIPADWIPDGTAYDNGRLYVCTHLHQVIRLYVADGSDEVEISTGDLFDPLVHFQGYLHDADHLQRILSSLSLQRVFY